MADEQAPGFEVSHGKPRLPRARMSDVNDGKTAERLEGRAENGQVDAENDIANGRAWKRALKATLPDHRDALKLYNGAVRQLSNDTPFARAECVRWVRHVLLESDLESAARIAGVSTPQGLKLLALSRNYGTTAERAATAILTFTRRKTPTAKAPTNGLEALRAQLGGDGGRS